MCARRTWDALRRGAYVWIDDTRNVILPPFLICAWPDAQPVGPETGTRSPGKLLPPGGLVFCSSGVAHGVLPQVATCRVMVFERGASSRLLLSSLVASRHFAMAGVQLHRKKAKQYRMRGEEGMRYRYRQAIA